MTNTKQIRGSYTTSQASTKYTDTDFNTPFNISSSSAHRTEKLIRKKQQMCLEFQAHLLLIVSTWQIPL
jgi:hypothetical protein